MYGATLKRKSLANPDIKLLHESTTRKILASAFEVHRTLGHGFLESVYEEALCLELNARGIAIERQVELVLQYKGHYLPNKFRADLIVEGKVLVENKASTRLTQADEAQLLNYLRATGMRVGLLLNFGEPSLKFSRRIL